MSISFRTISRLSEDQRDALAEIVNIGMGQAGAALAQVLGEFVILSVPRIRLVDSQAVPETLAELVGAETIVSAIRQPFHNHLHGEAIVVYDEHGCRDLADIMGHDECTDERVEQELLLDIGNILAGASLKGVAEQLQAELTFSPPSILATHVPVERLLNPETLDWSYSLLIEVNFTLEARRFKGHLLIMLSEDSIDTLVQDIDTFLESL